MKEKQRNEKGKLIKRFVWISHPCPYINELYHLFVMSPISKDDPGSFFSSSSHNFPFCLMFLVKFMPL